MNNPAEDEWVTGRISIEIAGHPIDMTMTVPARPVKPQRMLPIFREMANSFVDIGVRAAEDAGRKVSCSKGCGACCRQPVPVAEIEAYQLAELVDNLPEPRRSEVRERFEKAAAHFAGIGWFEKLSASANETPKEQQQVVLEYFNEGVPCPFLIEESCSIHPDRPVACREYLVTSPASNCTSPSAESVDMIELPMKPSKSLMKVGQVRQITGVNFIPLVLSLKWARMNSESFPEKTGEQWMADFFRNLGAGGMPDENDQA